MESKEQNKQNRNIHIDTENRLMDAKGVGRLGEKDQGFKSTNWQLQNSHGHGQSTGNLVNNIVITMMPGGILKYWGEHFVKYMIV